MITQSKVSQITQSQRTPGPSEKCIRQRNPRFLLASCFGLGLNVVEGRQIEFEGCGKLSFRTWDPAVKSEGGVRMVLSTVHQFTCIDDEPRVVRW